MCGAIFLLSIFSQDIPATWSVSAFLLGLQFHTSRNFICNCIASYRIVSYHRPELTTLREWHVEHSATLGSNSESPRMSDAHAIAEWHKSSNWFLNHHLREDNKHAWKIEDGQTRGPGTENRENECDSVVVPSSVNSSISVLLFEFIYG
jgi:hypothetical protein